MHASLVTSLTTTSPLHISPAMAMVERNSSCMADRFSGSITISFTAVTDMVSLVQSLLLSSL